MTIERWMAVSDTHGELIDQAAARAALGFAKKYKPHRRFHLGDYTDMTSLRSGASTTEEYRPIRPDVDAAVKFIKAFRPTDVLEGNHDLRLQRDLDHPRPARSEYAKLLFKELSDVLQAIGAKWLPYCKRRGVLRYGDYSLIHGYHSGMYAVKQAASVYANVIMGHVHRVDRITWPSIDGPKYGVSVGCLAILDQGYNRAQVDTLRQEHAFAYGTRSKSNRLDVRIAHIRDGQIVSGA